MPYEKIPGAEPEKESKSPLEENMAFLMEVMSAIGHFQQIVKENQAEINSLDAIVDLSEDQSKILQMLREHVTLDKSKIQELEEKFSNLSIERKNLLNS